MLVGPHDWLRGRALVSRLLLKAHRKLSPILGVLEGSGAMESSAGSGHGAVRSSSEAVERLNADWSAWLRAKKACSDLPWITADEARRLPYLDCKGFAVLASERARQLGLDAKVRVGVSTPTRKAHAYVAIEDNDRTLCYSTGFVSSTDEEHVKRSFRIDLTFDLSPRGVAHYSGPLLSGL